MNYLLSKNNQVVTLAAKTLVITKYDVIQIEPQLLFQRLSVIASKEEDPSTTLKYELCSYPAALFESFVLQPINLPLLMQCENMSHSHIPCHLQTFTICLKGIPYSENSLAQKRVGWSHMSIIRGLCNSKVLKSNHCIWWLSCSYVNQGYYSLARDKGLVNFSGQTVISSFFW